MKKLLWTVLAFFVWAIIVLLSAGMHLMLIIGGNNKLHKFLDKLTALFAIDVLALLIDTCPAEWKETKQCLCNTLNDIVYAFNLQLKNEIED